MSTETKVELLGCPFCGDKPELVKGYFGYQSMHNGDSSFKLQCRTTECFRPSTPLYGNEADCIAAWNRRALPASDRASELEAALEKVLLICLDEDLSETDQVVAKAAAQADYEARIRSAIKAAP